MAVRIFVEKENEFLNTHTNHPKLLSGSSMTDTSLLQTPQTGKVLTITPRLQQSARKALGDVNCSLRAGSITGYSQKKRPDKVNKKKSHTQIFKNVKDPILVANLLWSILNQHSTRSFVQKSSGLFTLERRLSQLSTEKFSISEPPKCTVEKSEDYPEIETFIPYNPFDFENFNVPEEHKIDHICLAGLPLFFLEKEEALIEKVLNKIPSPIEWPSLSKESDLVMDFDMNADILADLDEIGEVELPIMEDDFGRLTT
ncbi:securin isoform X1 [Carcharodon carcharias]|uniref:securin isoform X1 n=1 Tax=Carcharodon carcharias TaxID=13397 RepID=UPI001B7F3258|nr:securin isoform X1 [Carcharodon carcharias]